MQQPAAHSFQLGCGCTLSSRSLCGLRELACLHGSVCSAHWRLQRRDAEASPAAHSVPASLCAAGKALTEDNRNRTGFRKTGLTNGQKGVQPLPGLP